MALKKDFATVFQELGVGLVPPDETVRAVITAMPKGESWRRSRQSQLRWGRPAPTPITYEGIAAGWPNYFARHESVPDSWSAAIDWFFWIVITDEQLHAFEGRSGKGWSGDPTVGPEAAHFPLDQIDEIAFRKSLISQLAIWFEDGSSVELDVGYQNLVGFMDAIRPFERPGSPRAPRGGSMPPQIGWWLGLALLGGGMAVTVGPPADPDVTSTVATVLVIVGIVAIVAGNYFVLRAWRSSGWKRRRWVGIPLALLGGTVAAASFDKSCECAQMLYIGSALAVIGLVAQFGSRE